MKLKKLRYFKLPDYDRRLTWQVLPLLVEARWRLWRTPFPVLHAQWRARVQQALEEHAAPYAIADLEPDRPSIDEVWGCAHAVRRTARLVPLASCLTQAMALQLILARRGHPCSVCIGVHRQSANAPLNAPMGAAEPDAAQVVAAQATANQGESSDPSANGSDLADGNFRAHAWVEWQGRVVIGGDVSRWRPLTIWAPVAVPARAPEAAN